MPQNILLHPKEKELPKGGKLIWPMLENKKILSGGLDKFFFQLRVQYIPENISKILGLKTDYRAYCIEVGSYFLMAIITT